MEPLLIGAALINLYAVVLVVARAGVYRTQLYRPMLWNIWLSIVPVLILAGGLIIWSITALTVPVLGVIVLIVVGIAWLLMLPNASYLITELNQSHRREGEDVPLWYDIILVISLAMSGVANTVVNVFIAHFFFTLVAYGDRASAFVEPAALTVVAAMLLLLSFGMYLGRCPRVNSWDIRHPVSFVQKLRTHFGDRGNLLACLGFTLTHVPRADLSDDGRGSDRWAHADRAHTGTARVEARRAQARGRSATELRSAPRIPS